MLRNFIFTILVLWAIRLVRFLPIKLRIRPFDLRNLLIATLPKSKIQNGINAAAPYFDG
jgi:hypothetical protein